MLRRVIYVYQLFMNGCEEGFGGDRYLGNIAKESQRNAVDRDKQGQQNGEETWKATRYRKNT